MKHVKQTGLHRDALTFPTLTLCWSDVLFAVTPVVKVRQVKQRRATAGYGSLILPI